MSQWQTYVYDGEGKRIKRIVNGTETWQVHGLAGELVAEYAPITSPSSPQKEFGYRNGQLLITAGGGSGPQPVTWTNTVGVTANGNSLTKTAAEGWGNAGAASTQSIASGDGYVETTISETNTYRMIGLSNGDSHQNYYDIDFAFYPAIGGTLYIYEGGTSRGTFGTYATGDVLRVAVEGGVVKYRKNGTLLYTTTVSATYPLLVDTSLYSNGATLNNVVISGAGGGGGGSSTQIRWIVTDRLGTPRMIFDQTGSYSSVSRHDYLPFGEELYAGVGGRTTGLGYTNLDGLRQRFTGYEHDVETGLDYAQARYHASQQGRFTSVDPLGASAEILDPQTFNRYSYVLNDPVNLTDPDGLMAGADQGWSSVASGFWGSSAGFDRPRAGAEIIGHRLSLHDTGIKRRQIELRQQQGFTNTEGEAVIVTYTVAFMSRQEAIAYYESQFGGPVAEYRGRFVLGRALWARQWQNRIAGGIDAASPFGFLTRAIAEKTVGGPPADETSDEYSQGETVVTVASVIVPSPAGKLGAATKGAKFFSKFAKRGGFNQSVKQIGRFTEFSVSVQGNNAMSYTRYVKVVNEQGRTVKFYHDTFLNTGKFIHRH